MKIKVLVRPEPLGGFSVSVPALPGCYSEGETLPEALFNIKEAAQLWLEVATEIQEENGSIPEAELQEIEL
jgi:predicted RNase H-like HicB family nuclease